ncbi:pantothenate kinase [Prosthecochloris sp. ZM]|nr:pantothenate kinase [Prosthecochloris sp. ZM]
MERTLFMREALLIIEIGNSSTDIAVFQQDRCLECLRVPTISLASLRDIESSLNELLQRHQKIRVAGVCSVVPRLTDLFAVALKELFSMRIVGIDSTLDLPFRFEYSPRESFGPDRIALLAISAGIYPQKAVIAVDIGTAMTFDVLDSSHCYRGGMILPGIDLMAFSLHDRTARLPLVRISDSASLLGRSTESCIRSGIYWGCIKQVDGILGEIRDFLQTETGDTDVEVLMTGGNCRMVASGLSVAVTVDEHAVLKGAGMLVGMNSA